ncbi:MAG: phosphatidate cytidylyltransferase [Acholeplasmatales bacterium]|nr:phosphatidate cytidylyltransferase [Acholeplasmatales bacterium]
MKKRIITGIVMGIILIPLVVIPQLKALFEIVMVLMLGAASFELFNMYDKQKKLPLGIKIIGTLLTFLLYSSVLYALPICDNTLIVRFLDCIDLELTPVLSMGIIFIVLMAMMIFKQDFDASDVGKIYIAVMYIGICIAGLTALRFYGVRFIAYLLLITVCTDIFALVFGLNFGKHKMAPVISPKKSWEGAIGGSAVAVIVGFLFIYLYPHFSSAFHEEGSISFFAGVLPYDSFTEFGKICFIILLTTGISICSQIGDLVASKLKRTYGIKDFSNLFPGHGGVLDRFDSALFSSVIFVIFILIMVSYFGV